MKNLRILAAATLFALTSITMLAGCGPTEGGNDEDGKVCKNAEECADGYACVEYVLNDKNDASKGGKGKCRVDCAKNDKADQTVCDSKAAGKVCKGHPYESNGVTKYKYACSPKAGGQPGGDECSATKACTDGTKICNTETKKCVPKCNDNSGCSAVVEQCDTQKHYCIDSPLLEVVIVDLSPSSSKACKAPNDKDAGADIVGVEAVNGKSGDSIAWGYNDGEKDGTVPADITYHDNQVPDGNALTPSSNQCSVDGKLSENKGKGKFNSIGCGGSVAIKFNKPFKKGDKIKVFEYDKDMCKGTSGGAPDIYEVYACRGTGTGPEIIADKDNQCVKISEGDTTGFGEFTVD